MSSFGIPNVAPELETTLIRQMAEVESLLLSHTRSEYPFVDETAHHLVAAGGKRLRPLLTLLTAQFGDSTRQGVIAAAVACEITHLATLYHDDVMDEAPLRRGVESANMRWGNTIAILTGDFLFAKSSDLLADLGPEAVRLQARTFERLVIGQIMETQGPNPGQDPLEHYLKVVADKTGSLIAASARYGGMISGAPAEITDTVTKFGEKIGVAFQLADDVIDIASESNQSGKTPGTDLREGVPTLVTLNVMKSNDPADTDLKRLLSAPIEDEPTVQQVLVALRNHKALDGALDLLTQRAQAPPGTAVVDKPTPFLPHQGQEHAGQSARRLVLQRTREQQLGGFQFPTVDQLGYAAARSRLRAFQVTELVQHSQARLHHTLLCAAQLVFALARLAAMRPTVKALLPGLVHTLAAHALDEV